MARSETWRTVRWGEVQPLTARESAELDRMSAAAGTPVRDLMECAGWQCARWIAEQYGDPEPFGHGIAIFVGSGNNGGDGLVAARHLLDWGYHVEVVCTSGEAHMGELSSEHLLRARNAGIPVAESLSAAETPESVHGVRILVDAILGTGSILPLRKTVANVCMMLNAVHALRLSIDVPTGTDATTGEMDAHAFRPDATLCLGAPKSGCLGGGIWGSVYVADLPIPKSAWDMLGRKRSVDRGRIVRIVKADDAQVTIW